MTARAWQIGDTEALPDWWDREEWARRRRTRGAATITRTGVASPIAHLRAQDMASAERSRQLAECPVEKAKLVLRRAGIPVYAASVHRPGAEGHVIGGQVLDNDELIARASRVAARAAVAR
ncbi:MAG: hypothetical protein SNJ79_01405 [Sphingomonadaceae bacterium]